MPFVSISISGSRDAVQCKTHKLAVLINRFDARFRSFRFGLRSINRFDARSMLRFVAVLMPFPVAVSVSVSGLRFSR
jgi:hypothetical protein